MGASPDYPGLYNQVMLIIRDVPTSEKFHAPPIEKFHQMLSFLNLQGALEESSVEDLERLKIGHLFRTFYPRQALPLERTEEFFNLSIEKLKDLIIHRVPEMQDKFSEYLSKVVPYETIPGRVRYRISGLAQKCYELGGRALIHALGGEGEFKGEDSFDELVSIMRMGLLSYDFRRKYGVGHERNKWSNWDIEGYATGSADSVFTRLITEENCRTSMPLSGYSYMKNARCGVIVSLNDLETGTYQQHDQDLSAGARGLHDGYLNRPGILEFIQQEQTQFNGDNEVMVKERIPPSMIQAFVFTDLELRDRFVKYLRTEGLIKEKDGLKTIFGRPLESFVQYASHMSEELIRNNSSI